MNIQSRVPFNEIPVHLQKGIRKNEELCENQFRHLIKFHSINQQSKKMIKHEYNDQSNMNNTSDSTALIYNPTPDFIPDESIRPKQIYMHDRSLSRANQSKDDFDTIHNDLHAGHENPYEMYPKLALRNLQNLYSTQPRKIPIKQWTIDQTIEKRLGLHIRTPIYYYQFNNDNGDNLESNNTSGKNKSSMKKRSKGKKPNASENSETPRKYVWEIDDPMITDVADGSSYSPILNNTDLRDAFGNDIPAFHCGDNQVW